MDTEKLQEIRKAEQQAAGIIQSIEEESQELLGKARSTAQRAMENAKAASRKEAESLSAQYHKQGHSTAAGILSSLEGDLANIDKHADVSEKEAVSLVLSEMKVIYGHR